MSRGKRRRGGQQQQNQAIGCLVLIALGVIVWLAGSRGGRSESPTDNPQPVVTPTLLVFTPEAGLMMTMEPATYYAQGRIFLRSCPQTSCEEVATLTNGQAVTVDGAINGEAVNVGNAVWYRVRWQGGEAYAYSDILTPRPPAAPTSAPVQQQVSQPSGAASSCPANCDEARAQGMTAQQAAACGLDRDGDGVACYGD